MLVCSGYPLRRTGVGIRYDSGYDDCRWRHSSIAVA
jgi:hypothetical protein